MRLIRPLVLSLVLALGAVAITIDQPRPAIAQATAVATPPAAAPAPVIAQVTAATSIPEPLPAAAPVRAAKPGRPTEKQQKAVVEALGRIPLTFERNAGQFPQGYDFGSRVNGQAFLVNGNGARIAIGADDKTSAQFGLTFAGARCNPPLAGGDIAETWTNYIYGNDAAKWLTRVPSYRTVRYDDVYPGVDVEYHARRGNLEYDFIVEPGADWRGIALEIDGASARLDESGHLLLRAGDQEVRHDAPIVYQELDGRRSEIASSYTIAGNRVSFSIGEFDPALPLVIDPMLDFSRAIFPLYDFKPSEMALDSFGNVYIGGVVWGPSVKALTNTGSAVASQHDLLIAKFNPDVTSLLFTTHVGGSLSDGMAALALDANGVYVTGSTLSGDFPTTVGAFGEYVRPGATPGGLGPQRAYVVKLDGNSGAVQYATYLERLSGVVVSRADITQPTDIAVDAQGRAIVVGGTSYTGYPTTPGAYRATGKDFLTKLSADGKKLVFSTFLGGNITNGVAVDPSGFIYTGGAADHELATTEGAYDRTAPPTGGVKAYLAKFDEDGKPVFVTYHLGKTVTHLLLETDRDIITSGFADCLAPRAPISGTAYQFECRGSTNVILGKLSNAGTALQASTYFGGTSSELPTSLALGQDGSIVLMGYTTSTLPLVNPLQSEKNPEFTQCCPYRNYQFSAGAGDDDFIARFDANLSTLTFSTYWGPDAPNHLNGLVVDGANRILLFEEDNLWLKGNQVPYAASGPILHEYRDADGVVHRKGPLPMPNGARDPIIARISTGAVPPPLSIDWVYPNNTNFSTSYHYNYIYIRGTGFVDGCVVSFGTKSVSKGGNQGVFAGGTLILVKPPAQAAGVVDIKVTNPNSNSVTVPNAFQYGVPIPRIDTFAPPALDSLGTRTTVEGQGLDFPGTPIMSFEHPLGRQFTRDPIRNDASSFSFTVPALSSLLMPSSIIAIPKSPRMPGFPKAIAIVDSPAPTVADVRPVTGSATGGTLITIIGSNFHPDARVMIGHVYSKRVTYLNAASVQAVVPPNPTPGPATVVVINPDDASASLANVFSYVGPTGISPNIGSVDGGLTITITGSGFTGSATVIMGGVAASNVTVVNSTTITAVTPPHSPGVVDVAVNFGGAEHVMAGAFTYRERPPGINSVNPSSGPETGGTAVTITGADFQPGAEAFFGGVKATSTTWVSATQLNATTAAHLAGVVDVVVKNPDTQAVTSLNAFRYRGIAGISPAQGVTGTAVTITGAGFVFGATVTIGGVAAGSVNVVDETRITATSPDHAPGFGNVVITNPGGETFTLVNGFKFLPPPPTITGFTPPNAYPGDNVVITGTNFLYVTAVKFFNNKPATFAVDSSTQITAVVPVPATTGPITVVTESGSANSASFTVENAAAVINDFTPAGGPPGTEVTLNGSRMFGATAVTFGGVAAASFEVISSTQVKAVAPTNGVTGPICVTTPGPFTGCSATSYTFAARITSFTPVRGVPGTSVTITGTDFTGATEVTFNGVAATPFTVNSATSITTTVPAGATTGPIEVVTPLGSGDSTSSFGVPPEITSFTPARAGFGRNVVITGVRFTGTTSVRFFNDVSATFTVVNDSEINATVPPAAVDGPITVNTPGGTATTATSFQVAQTPLITSFTPNKGTPGTVVTITGTNFVGTSSVKFNGATAAFSATNTTTISATVPTAATNGPISITNAEGEGTSADLFYLPPVLSSFSPNAGVPGSTVQIVGNNFIGTTSVTINNIAAAFVVNAQDTITATVPTGATSGPIRVTTPYGPVSSAFTYTVLGTGTPTVIAVATSATSVALSWSGDPAGTYDVRRINHKNENFTMNTIARVTGTSYLDNTAVAGKTYLYNILNVGTGSVGNHDFATTIMFQNDPLTVGAPLRAVHLTQIRDAVNAMRVAAALSTRTWTDPVPNGIPPKAVHITELRQALLDALLSLGRHASFSDSSLTAGMPVRAVHMRELREAVK